MKNKFSIFVIVVFLSFCFVIFYKGLNTPNNYTPKVNEIKNVPTFKAKDFYSNNYVNSDKIFEENTFYIVNMIISEFLLSIFDLIHLSRGPRDINNRNGIKKGTINFW